MKALFALLVLLAIVTVAPRAHATPSTTKGPEKAAPAAKPLPDVQLPFTFTCPHCNMKITIKTQADWTKDCFMCACGETNLGCYNDSLKKTPAKTAKSSDCSPGK